MNHQIIISVTLLLSLLFTASCYSVSWLEDLQYEINTTLSTNALCSLVSLVNNQSKEKQQIKLTDPHILNYCSYLTK